MTRVATMLLLLLGLLTTAPAQATHKPKGQELIFAYFPVAVPIAPLGEVMRRDLLLQKNLAKQGMTIRFQPLTKGKDAVDLIKQKQLDGVSFSDLPTIESIATGDMQLLGFVKQSFSAVLAPTGTQIKDLRRKRIGTVPGSTSHYALLQALHAAGIREQEVSLVAMEAVDLREALARGTVDAIAAWEPTPTAVVAAYPGRFSQIHRQASYSYFLLSPQLLEKHPAAARELAASLLRAIRWMKKSNRNLAKASQWARKGLTELTGKTPQITAAEIAQITANDLLKVPGAPFLPANEGNSDSPLNRMFTFMHQQGKLPPTATWDTARACINPDLLREISANPVKYGLNRYDYAP